MFAPSLARALVASSAGVAVLAVAAGCNSAGGASPASPLLLSQAAARSASSARTQSSAHMPHYSASGCGKQIVYAASYDNTVYIYDQMHNGKTACGAVTGLTNPQGLFVDKSQNLWVVNGGNGRSVPSEVLEFAPGNPNPIKTLSDSTGFPVDVAVDNNSGTVYVTNFFQNGSKPGVVEVYAGGSTTPTSTLSDPNMTYAFYDAVDNQGNLYVTYLEVNGPSGVGRVNEWIGGTGSAIDLGITLVAPGGIQTTSSGALLICDQAAPACGQFTPGSTTMTNLIATKDPDPFAIALDAKERHAFIEDLYPSTPGILERWAFPGPRKRQQEKIPVPGGAYAGVATSPAAVQGAPYTP
jgi:hypothetical protein